MPNSVVGPTGPGMGPCGPTFMRRCQVRSVVRAPQAAAIQDPNSSPTKAPPENWIEQYHHIVSVDVFTPRNPGSSVTLTFLDSEMPKPIQPGQWIDMVIQLKPVQINIGTYLYAPPGPMAGPNRADAIWPVDEPPVVLSSSYD